MPHDPHDPFKAHKPRGPVDLVRRGVKKSSPAGTLTYLAIRPLGPLLQLALLKQPPAWGTHLLSFLGLSAEPAGAGEPLPLPHLLLVAMSSATAAKHLWWETWVSYEYFPVSSALFVTGYNTIMDSLNSLLFLHPATSSLTRHEIFGVEVNPAIPSLGGLPLTMVAGTALFVLGLGMEVVAEYQRRQFKEKRENAGKLYRAGLWSLTRHANYCGYVLWRAGYALASAGWVAGAVVGFVQAYDFITRGIPAIESYCRKKYGEQWKKYEHDVKYALIPGIY